MRPDDTGTQRVINIMVDISDAVGFAHHPAFQRSGAAVS
ncbi:hypothetical protein SDC9_127227 [bioreactor metagenome]|uniref:Uncharacterized protein n=1 Tax=bioreactor metagenome TaxID=1076179 RepID=A0A645CSR9_9ZZZZ